MAYAVSNLAQPTDLALPATTSLRLPSYLRSVLQAPVTALRKRWIYHCTLAELQDYSERNLKDIGAAHGVRDFARRAAGL